MNRATIQAAKLLLKNNDMMAYEIADRINFPSASAFSKFFKRETGITPRAYQESTRK
ncbi:helix-turn-helix domain-containing protein [Hoylesella nanceiensis]|uniref:helix-turn-helix domain-containing protein n=1 Tax=Hoylesella nanceiensis TaxID=425941 RepID=UPI0030140C9E